MNIYVCVSILVKSVQNGVADFNPAVKKLVDSLTNSWKLYHILVKIVQFFLLYNKVTILKSQTPSNNVNSKHFCSNLEH